jgi:plastocyanin
VRIRRLLPIAIATVAVLFSACGGDNQTSGADTTTATTATTVASMTTVSGGPTTTDGMSQTKSTITAKNVAFVPNKLTIAANTDVEVIFDNRDASVPHNIHFFTPTEVKTDVKEGKADGVKETVKLKVDKAGDYDFTCDVHPTMKGVLTVQ